MPDNASISIGRSMSISFATRDADDQELRAELQELLNESEFSKFSDFAKHLFRIALDAQGPQQSGDAPVELLQKLTVIQQQLAELRQRDTQLDSLASTLQSVDRTVGDVNDRTKAFRHALGAAVVAMLVEVADWEGEKAMRWVSKNVLKRPMGEEE